MVSVFHSWVRLWEELYSFLISHNWLAVGWGGNILNSRRVLNSAETSQ